jgi:osmoprotectant transport system permease protein
VPSLGTLFTDGLFRSFPTEIAVGIAIILLLALVLDLALVLTERLLTPWARRARSGSTGGSTDDAVALEAKVAGA